MNTTLKTLTTAALAIAFARASASTQTCRVGVTTQRPAYASPAPVADDGGVPLPMAGGVIAIVMLSFGGVAAAAKRRKTVRPAFPTC